MHDNVSIAIAMAEHLQFDPKKRRKVGDDMHELKLLINVTAREWKKVVEIHDGRFHAGSMAE